MTDAIVNDLSTNTQAPEPVSPGRQALRRFRKNRPAVISAGLLLVVLAFSALFPFFSAYGPSELSAAQFQPPSGGHWLGTDVHGRDLLVRLCYGARISLLVGFVGAGISLVIGVLWGTVSGYIGGRMDAVMMRIVDVLYSLPSIIFVIVLLTTVGEPISRSVLVQQSPLLGKPIRVALLVVALGAVSWLTMARIVRGQVLSLRTRPFIEASRALGAGPWRIVSRHIIPNVLGVVIVYLTLSVPSIILYESFLSFLGFGIQPPMASWGSLIAEGVNQINPIRIYWWLIVFPSAALVSTLLALNFIGDGLRAAWDVKGES